MANDIYRFTLDGLTSLVSPRAAERLLKQALRRAGQRPDSVGAEAMREILLGPLRRELGRSLPGEAVERRLQQLGRQLLRHYAPTPTPAPTPAPAPAATPVARALTPARERTATPAAVLEPAPPPPERAADLAAEPPAGSAKSDSPRASAPADPARLEAAALRFAQLEQVRLVAVLSRRGEVRFSRGGGLELEALSRIASLGWTLLGRQGQLRAVYLAQPAGQLFLFPLDDALLAVVGHPEINVGLVFATLSTLKEDL